MSSKLIPTIEVTLKASGDRVIINQTAFDPELHETESKADKAKAEKAKADKLKTDAENEAKHKRLQKNELETAAQAKAAGNAPAPPAKK